MSKIFKTMSSKYYFAQRNKQQDLIGTAIFNGDKGNGLFKNKPYPFVLSNGDNNIFSPVVVDAKKYFNENGISWWSGDKPTGHVLSSQIACINHLFAIRKDKNAVLKVLNGVLNEFSEVLPIECDNDKQYIAFEVVSTHDHLNEINTTRGANCTSVDAFILAKHKSGEIWLIPIEWKYVESYNTDDKSAGKSGETRKNRYNDLIKKSKQLKWFDDYKVYYQEPFYQLMRQTLWAEQVIANKATETLKADNFLHIHVIPKNNDALLKTNTRYPYNVSDKGMEDTWRSCLNDQSKYRIVDPEVLLSPVADEYNELVEYLKKRYW